MKGRSSQLVTLSALLFLVALTIPALAVDNRQVAGNSLEAAPYGFLIVTAVCVWRRKEEIGGWLLFFYIQTYGGVIFTVLLVSLSFQNYLPSAWAANPSLYPLYLLSSLPIQILAVVVIVVAEMMRRTREYRFVQMLRAVLWIYIAAIGVGAVIDWSQFPENIPLDAYSLIFPAIWLPYFYRSARVSRVFKTKDWLIPPSLAPGAV
jgi:Protein of unknown function (DUF2569)